MNYLKNLSKIKIAILALIIANVIWGDSFPIYKCSLDYIPPFLFIFIRFFGGALILLPFAYKNLRIVKADIPMLILISIIGITIQIPLLFFGLKLTPSINAPIIIAVAPLIIIAASIIFLKEKLRAKILIGTLISLGGVILIILRPIIESGGIDGNVLGNLMILGATLCFVAQSILLKKLTIRNDPLGLTFWMFLIGVIPLLPFVFYELQDFSISNLNSQAIIGIIYGTVFAAAIAHFTFIYGLKYIKASEVGIFTYIDPIATAIVAIPLLDEKITITYLMGSILVFLGIYVAEGRIQYHPLGKLFAKE